MKTVVQAVKYCTPPIVVDAARRLIRGKRPSPDAPPPQGDFEAVVHGAKLKFPHDHQLPDIVKHFPFYDTALSGLCQFLLNEKGAPISVIDVGANVGDTASIIAAAVGPSNVHFICVEADDRYLPFFRENTSALSVKLINALAAEESGTATLSPVSDKGTSVFVSSKQSRPAIALDDLTTQADILKIDTDGHELSVLKGASRLLQDPQIALFIELAPQHIRQYGGIDPKEILRLIASAGFDSAIVYDNIGIPIGIFDTSGDSLAALSDYAERRPITYYLDLLFFRDTARRDRFFQHEIKRLPKLPPSTQGN